MSFDAVSQMINASVTRKLYKLSPQTRIFTVAKKYRMVFMVDVSSSLGTMDAGLVCGVSDDHFMRVKVLLGDVFDTWVFKLVIRMDIDVLVVVRT